MADRDQHGEILQQRTKRVLGLCHELLDLIVVHHNPRHEDVDWITERWSIGLRLREALEHVMHNDLVVDQFELGAVWSADGKSAACRDYLVGKEYLERAQRLFRLLGVEPDLTQVLTHLDGMSASIDALAGENE